jgi:hypothetical protein
MFEQKRCRKIALFHKNESLGLHDIAGIEPVKVNSTRKIVLRRVKSYRPYSSILRFMNQRLDLPPKEIVQSQRHKTTRPHLEQDSGRGIKWIRVVIVQDQRRR